MSLRRQLDALIPGWDRWHPSVFDAARDLGLIRARACPPWQLLLSNRHAGVTGEAIESFRKNWPVEYDPLVDEPAPENERVVYAAHTSAPAWRALAGITQRNHRLHLLHLRGQRRLRRAEVFGLTARDAGPDNDEPDRHR